MHATRCKAASGGGLVFTTSPFGNLRPRGASMAIRLHSRWPSEYHGYKVRLTKEELELLYHGQGKSLVQTAAILGTSKTTLRRVMRHLGIKIRSRSEAIRLSFRQVRKPVPQKKGKTWERLSELFGLDPSLKLTEYAAILGVSKQRVHQLLHQTGLRQKRAPRTGLVCPVCGGRKGYAARVCWPCWKSGLRAKWETFTPGSAAGLPGKAEKGVNRAIMGYLMDGETYLTVPEVAKRLRLGEESIRRALRQGKIPGKKIGQMHFVREADVERLVKAGEGKRE